MYEVDLVVYNSRRLVLDPEWTRVRPSLAIIDYIIQLIEESGEVQASSTGIGCSDHFEVCIVDGICREAKCTTREKHAQGGS